METFSTWEGLLLGAVAVLLIFWMGPGIKATMAQSANVQTDWTGVLLPLAFVVMFVIFLIAIV
jgi:membrane protein insertase Oxa1/YidC/SpoIIIJ